MNDWRFLIAACVLAFSANAETEWEKTVLAHMEKSEAHAEVKELAQAFEKKAQEVMAADLNVSAERLTPYISCLSQLREKFGPPPREKWQIDVVKIICDDEKVKKSEDALRIAKVRTDLFMSERAITLRFVGLIRGAITAWKNSIESNGEIFSIKCGNDERCLLRKQLARQRALILSSAARLKFIFLDRVKNDLVERSAFFRPLM